MYYFRQCECGCIDFEKEHDDNVYRCAECGRLARLGYIKDEEDEDENISNDN